MKNTTPGRRKTTMTHARKPLLHDQGHVECLEEAAKALKQIVADAEEFVDSEFSAKARSDLLESIAAACPLVEFI